MDSYDDVTRVLDDRAILSPCQRQLYRNDKTVAAIHKHQTALVSIQRVQAIVTGRRVGVDATLATERSFLRYQRAPPAAGARRIWSIRVYVGLLKYQKE